MVLKLHNLAKLGFLRKGKTMVWTFFEVLDESLYIFQNDCLTKILLGFVNKSNFSFIAPAP